MDNKFPGKDISIEDLKSKFPLTAKKNPNHKSKFNISGIEFGGDLIPIFAGPNMVESEKLIIDCLQRAKASSVPMSLTACKNCLLTENELSLDISILFLTQYKTCKKLALESLVTPLLLQRLGELKLRLTKLSNL